MRDDEFEQLFDAHAQALFGFLAYRLNDRQTAEDLVADTFERAYRARKRFDRRKATEKTWIYAIAMNALRDHVRRQDAQKRALDRLKPGELESDVDRATETLGARDELAAALRTLSDEERDAVALRFGADLTVPEMAKLLGESLTTMEGRVYRALRKLRKELQQP